MTSRSEQISLPFIETYLWPPRRLERHKLSCLFPFCSQMAGYFGSQRSEPCCTDGILFVFW